MGVLTAREVTEGLQWAREEELAQVAASGGGPGGDQAPSALQMRMRILEMSALFSGLTDGVLRAVASRIRAVRLAPRDTRRLGGQARDNLGFLAYGHGGR